VLDVTLSKRAGEVGADATATDDKNAARSRFGGGGRVG